MVARLLLALALAAAVSADAQPRVRTLTRADGLPSRYVFAVAQDTLGFVWAGTGDGLVRYDGRQLRTYRADGTPGALGDDLVTALLVARDGTLWVGTSAAGLYRFRPETETFVPLPKGAAMARVADLREGPDGRVWMVGGPDDLHVDVLDPATDAVERVQRAGRPLRPGWPVLSTTLAPRAGPVGLWAGAGPPGAEMGIARVDGPRAVPYPLSDGCDRHRPIGTPAGLFAVSECPDRLRVLRYDPAADHFEPFADGWGAAPSQAIPIPPYLWVLTARAVVRVPLAAPSGPLPAPTVAPRQPRRLIRDRAGDLWLGSADGLVQILTGDAPFETVTADALPDPDVNAIVTGPGGALWIGTTDGLTRLDRATGRAETLRLPPDGVYGTRVWSLAWDADGTLLVGTGGRGLFRLQAGRFEPVEIGEGAVRASRVTALRVEPDGSLWAATNLGLAHRAGTRGPLRLHRIGAAVRAVHRDREGQLWLGTEAGVVAWDEAAGRPGARYDARHGLGNPYVWALHSDARGVWIGTAGGGLHLLAPGATRLRRWTTADGLAHDHVVGVRAELGSGALWLSTSAGLDRLDPATGAVEHFSVADGLAGDAFNLMASHADGDELFFGGPRGVTAFRPAAVRRPRARAPLRFTGLHVGGAAQPGMLTDGGGVRLEPGERSFTVGFAALDFEPSRRHRYRYRLVGLDDDWREATDAAPEAAYTNVPPGRYRLEVGGLDRAGAQVTEAALSVVVAPRWWERGAVRAVALLLVVGAGGGGAWGAHRARVRATEAEAAREHLALLHLGRARDAERQRLARDLHDGPLQDLYGLAHRLDDLDGAADARRRLTAVADALRGVCTDLRPPLLAHFGPAQALRADAERLSAGGPQITVEAAVSGRALPEAVQVALYRVGREALANAVRHADADAVHVRLDVEGGEAWLTVEDDGRGFAVPPRLASLARAGHFGLVGAAERAEALGGRLAVTSTPGRGTRVEARVPVVPAE